VTLLGEDVGAYGGIVSSTAGLLEQFGPDRVMDTPISETGFIGLGIGAAVEGMRPIVELMFADFFGVCMDQIYNHMAKIQRRRQTVHFSAWSRALRFALQDRAALRA
jgi:pyruvate dehydrogenase E1 component beta subunit